MNPGDVLPHEPPMLMLTSVEHCDETRVHCRSLIQEDNPCLSDGIFPAYGGLELLAQASGVLLGKISRQNNPELGAIVQVKHFELNDISIPPGSLVDIHASFLGGSDEAAQFEGRVYFDSHQFFEGRLMIALLEENPD